ncbi:bifunctional 4-hydroxy-2-oxoglutarate aldolase/2-dehydro-3-deoxy-phosphogluconate aldolase [Agromyces sp. LHK192]|uniref:bifunctional 4-hydroxy-2-oxoglutarate aldolase/2-dehydro-3-deoxy-phosphogluconate aldolase n=1 Tax=Agromyces sp. LHK192 TaxID=2498704 RepID=UPI000FDBE26B|nr:bifunctional 4-hydroxy-2-oxoglutarate aldolase/2-dehydro-3-deoxy-phosphogluconate aldolase [Agromyces sp. LHK192]
MTDAYFQSTFADVPVMGIFRRQGLERTMQLAEAAWDVGVRIMEVPVMDSEDLVVLRAVADAARDRGLDVGAGTIVSVEQLDAVAAAGAAFTVAPGFDAEVAAASVARGLPHIPGVATGSEVQAALRAGFTWLKAFPAERLGPAWIRHLHGPFPQVRFVATGGVTPETAQSFLDAGCRVVALGSAFDNEEQIAKLGAILPRSAAATPPR